MNKSSYINSNLVFSDMIVILVALYHMIFYKYINKYRVRQKIQIFFEVLYFFRNCWRRKNKDILLTCTYSKIKLH